MKRRDVLRGAGASMLLAGIAGCLGGDDDSDEDTSDDETEEESDFPDENEGGENETDAGSELDEGENETGGDSEDNDTEDEAGDENETNETKNESDEEEEDRVPDKNETEPDKDQYEQQEEREIVELSEDTVDVQLQAEKIPESDTSLGGLRLHGNVTNVSDQYVDTVDLDLSFYDESEEYIGADIITVADLNPDESADVDHTISAYDLQGQPDSIEIDKMVYGPE